jgi:hypothetical protein
LTKRSGKNLLCKHLAQFLPIEIWILPQPPAKELDEEFTILCGELVSFSLRDNNGRRTW